MGSVGSIRSPLTVLPSSIRPPGGLSILNTQENRMGLDAPITAVTVFRDGARVQRTGVASVEPGLRPLVIGDLPASVDPGSVRVAARGRDLALLNVEVHHRYHAGPRREETARLRAEVDRWRDAVQALD